MLVEYDNYNYMSILQISLGQHFKNMLQVFQEDISQ